jgi:RNA polymerase sigma factor (sigma-70 family)
MDNVLGPYLSADDERERQQHLDELVTLRAAPLIRQVLRRRLGFYVNAQGINENNQDAEDLYQEAITRVVQVLNQLQASPTTTDLENFERYVSRLTSNVCMDFLRGRSPARTRLKDSLRDLFRRHGDLVSWEYEGEIVCGFAEWRNTGKSTFSDQDSTDMETKLETFRSVRFADEDIKLAPLSQILAELFDWIAGPVHIDVLVRMVAYLLDLKEQHIQSLDDHARRWDAYFPAHMQTGETHVQANELLAQVWHAVTQLPPEQRDAFAFGFEDQAGQDFFTVLLAASIVTWNELAAGMGRSVEQIARLRMSMPMDGATAADELGVAREKVWKWRYRALHTLKAKLSAR